MKNKIFGLLICLLLIIALLPASESKNYIIKETQNRYENNLNYYDADVPVWNIGDKWTYNMDFSMEVLDDEIGIMADLSLRNLELTVNNDAGNYYQINMNSDVEGSFTIDIEDFPIPSGTLAQTEINGQMLIEKETFGIKEIIMELDGRIWFSLLPINLNIYLTINFNPTYKPLSFPIEIGNEWIINSSDALIEGTIDLPGIAQLIPSIPEQIPINFEQQIGGANGICNSKENVTLNMGTYTAYNITIGDFVNVYYAPSAGNIIMLTPSSLNDDDYDIQFNFELISTNYIEPGAPNTPNEPDGPNQGEPNIEYTYSTSTTDNEGDGVYYLFDWDDGEYSEWLGPYTSGEIIEENHIWTEKGKYFVKVKAKDTEDHESPWSEPLTVTIEPFELFLFGRISDKTESDDTISFIGDSVKSLSFRPFEFKSYGSGTEFTVSSDSGGFIGKSFVFGRFVIVDIKEE